MKSIKVPIYGINPFLGIIKLEWFLTILPTIKKKDLNLFLVYNKELETILEEQGSIRTLIVKKAMVNKLLQNKNIGGISEVDPYTFAVVSKDNIIEELSESLNEIEDVDALVTGTALEGVENILFTFSKLDVAMDILVDNNKTDGKIITKII